MVSSMSRLVIVAVHLPKTYVDKLEELVRRRLYVNRSEAIRMAVRNLILSEYRRLEEVGVRRL